VWNIISLVLLVVLIILATTKLKMHPFLALLFAAILSGFLGGLDSSQVLEKLTEGFGNTLRSIGIVIACGTMIGTILQKSGGAQTIAATLLQGVGEKRAPLAMSMTGFIVSIPVFCDSGFVLLSSINRALSRKTGIPLAVLAIALASGLYTTHVFVPPTPGPLAAAGEIGAQISLVLILGLVVSVPTAGAGLLWALVSVRRFSTGLQNGPSERQTAEQKEEIDPQSCSRFAAFAPLLIPIGLIAIKSVVDYPTEPLGSGVLAHGLAFVGHPVIALLIGVLLSMTTVSSRAESLDWISAGLASAGSIILITGAGGAFGNILRATGMGDSLANGIAQWQLGIGLPFVIAAVLKSAQGSSTVAIITTAALVSPLLEPLGLFGEYAKALVVLAIGAGAMTVSHLNDSYFWVVAQFSDMDTATALRCHTLATLVQGLVGIATIGLLKVLLVG
jgi:GntP family gluconate:H+ symporter